MPAMPIKKRNINGQQKPQPPADMVFCFRLRQCIFRFFLCAVTGFLNDFGDVGSGSFAVVKRNLRLLAGKVYPCRFDKIFLFNTFSIREAQA